MLFITLLHTTRNTLHLVVLMNSVYVSDVETKAFTVLPSAQASWQPSWQPFSVCVIDAQRSLGTEAIKSLSLTLQGVHHIHGSHRLAVGVLSVGH